MRVAIIGASGLLGGHLIEVGLQKNYEILAIARSFPVRSGANFFKEKVSLKALDATNELKAHDLVGCDTVINCAALVSANNAPELVEKNLALVKNVFTSASEARVKKLIQISSISTMADGGATTSVSERDHGKFRNTSYAESKYRSDDWLSNEFERSRELLTIHPCYMLGKWDAKPSSGAILMALQMGRLKGFFPGVKNFVHAGDVASGIYAAVERNATGRYILGGENHSFEFFIQRCLEALKLERKLTELSMTDLVLNPSLKEFFLANPVDDSKARKDWGYDPKVSLDAMLTETVTYFRENRLLPKTRS